MPTQHHQYYYYDLDNTAIYRYCVVCGITVVNVPMPVVLQHDKNPLLR